MKNPERWSHEYRDFIAKLVNGIIMLYVLVWSEQVWATSTWSM